VGALLLLFGLRWLRKAILRAAGVIPLYDETATFAAGAEAMRGAGRFEKGWDKMAFTAAFKITMLEGIEVVFTVIAIGAAGVGLLVPAGLAALAALFVAVGLGLVVHRPLANLPENTLKFGVAVLLCAFGAFWFGESVHVDWPGHDWSIFGLIGGFSAV